MEYFDILDEKGNKTGESRPRGEVHKKGLWHRAVHVWFVNSKNEILLQGRADMVENYPGMWDISAAGHMSAGDDSITAALREVKEEIGLDLNLNDLELVGEVVQQTVTNNGTYINNEYNDIYIVRMDIDVEKLKMQKEEVKDLKWVSIEELKMLIGEETPKIVPHPKEYELLFKLLEN